MRGPYRRSGAKKRETAYLPKIVRKLNDAAFVIGSTTVVLDFVDSIPIFDGMLARITCLFAICAGAAFADGVAEGAATPETPVLIVDRRADNVSLFLTLPAVDIEPLFGMGAEALLDESGTIDIDALYEGTFDLADQIFSDVTVTSAAGPMPFEAMSMMVHDPAVLPAFRTPWDGETAIAVCTSPETVDLMGLEPLQAYLGYFAWKVNGLEPFSLTFPDTTSDTTVLEVREFWNAQHMSTSQMTLGADPTLHLDPGTGTPLGQATLWLLAIASFAVGAVFLLLHRRSPKVEG